MSHFIRTRLLPLYCSELSSITTIRVESEHNIISLPSPLPPNYVYKSLLPQPLGAAAAETGAGRVHNAIMIMR